MNQKSDFYLHDIEMLLMSESNFLGMWQPNSLHQLLDHGVSVNENIDEVSDLYYAANNKVKDEY